MPFDRDYYRRFYYDPRTAVTTKNEMKARAHLIAAFVEHTGLPVRRILDAGCGTGMLRGPLLRKLPQARYTGLEASEYLCERYGWEHGEIDKFSASSPFDLVICYDVLQYLDVATATVAIENFAKLCRGILYFSALTKLDWEFNCDTSRTDAIAKLRTGNWYRKRLRQHFSEAGAGFWLRKGAPVTLWELESV